MSLIVSNVRIAGHKSHVKKIECRVGGVTYKTRKEKKKNSCKGCVCYNGDDRHDALCETLRNINVGQPHAGSYGACGGRHKIWIIKEVG